MCGICGALALEGQPVDPAILARMVETLRHRGPDDSGVEIIGPCGLGNTRLAIIDLSQAGHQPMSDPDRRAWIAYNGEAYNFLDLRPALEARGARFRSATDTETLLAAYLLEGEGFLDEVRGMFALAIWDVDAGRLLLARDRLGQKPLYYCQAGGWFIFGSEIKALLQHPATPRRVNVSAIPHYLAYGYAPTPLTMFEGTYCLPPGHTLTISPGQAEPSIQAYWEPPFPASQPDARSEDDLAAELLDHLRQAVRLRLISDVPLGAFLSGGLDSSAIVALMAEAGGRVRTFSIGFTGESSFDETTHAREVADRFGTDHQEFIVKPDALELLPRLVWHHDQPFGDSSAIPTYLVSLHTRRHVTVALSGDGGDELFAGYDRFYAARLAEGYTRLPHPVRAALEGTLRRLPENTAYRGVVRNANRFVRAASKPLPERYLEWVRFVPDTWLRGLMGEQAADAVLGHYAAAFDGQPNGDITARLLDVNLRTYLPDDLLVKADRMSMAVSLEARAPFLDHKLVEFTARLPSSLKLRRRASKYILKRALRGILPHHIIERPKHGFGVPIGRWFREGMADFVRDTLLSRRALERGYFAEEAVRGIIRAHLSGKRDLGHALWALLTFELWQQSFFDGGT